MGPCEFARTSIGSVVSVGLTRMTNTQRQTDDNTNQWTICSHAAVHCNIGLTV